MYTLTVNGKRKTCSENKHLLDFLRDDLRLTGAKNGCGSGACGACTVLVDGRAARACVVTLDKLDGKSVVTVEGLSEREADVYSWAFAEAGAVQCGFCIPGMVMSAKGLLDQNPDPSPDDVKKSLRGNICRCTGYVKIEDAVRLAARIFRSGEDVPRRPLAGRIGEDFHRVDSVAKTLGTGLYADDVEIEGMLYASALRTPHPRALVKSIDASEALAHDDCRAVFTARDVPGSNKIGHLAFISDWDVMIAEGDATRYVGDAVALVVSEKRESLSAIKSLVRVDYDVYEPVSSPAEALAEGAPRLHENGNILSHEHLIRGDAKSALEKSKYVVTRHYSVPFTEHAFMEPECAIGMPEGRDGILLYTAGQSIYDEQREVARMLGLPREKVHVKGMLVGGGFGGKEDMSVQHHAALAAWLLKRPVKVGLSRQESILVHPKRHAMEMDFTTGCDENGIITATKAVVVSDTGAYASLGGPVLQRACTHAAGPYNYQNIDIEGTAVYTNNPPGGAFRGFGVCQTAFAIESNLNMLAEMAGISPWEIRYRNAVKPGDVLPNGQVADESTAVRECLMAVRDAYEGARFAGVSAFFKNSGVGVGLPDTSRCIVSVEGGRAHIRTSAACIGQGLATVVTQIVCEVTGLPPDLIVVEPPDTGRTPDAGTTTASRQTVFTGESTRRAASMLRSALDAGKSLDQLEGEEFYAEYLGETDPMGSDKENPRSHVAYGYAAEVVELEDDGRIKRIVAAYDLGSVINPKAAEGQIEGGIVMGLGYALTEDYPLENCVPKAKYGTLGLFRATEVPPMEIITIRGRGSTDVACGAKGVGELATIPTAPAAAGAYYALDGKLRLKLPMEDTFYRRRRT
ncbi:MAG: selenium-dependent xanthine dehydrogenase [Synergistaceae bacterium]|jgi:selenium-dependent xanthine dehydrogenase|nr:selenium-dependent xanthine dehydrogenase [Synergistaceae bacterium]